jgi:ribonuclease M5
MSMAGDKRIKIEPIVILEGKYDKIKLESLVNTVIIKTDGFSIFRDKEKQKLIRTLAAVHGAVIATDPDAAGFQIRAFLQSLLKGCTIYHLYIPDIAGKEKRKSAPSKEGKLGVEGVSLEILEHALEQCGVTAGTPFDAGLTKADLYELGLSGRPESATARNALKRALNLPERMSANALLAVLNRTMTKNELARFIEQTGAQGE